METQKEDGGKELRTTGILIPTTQNEKQDIHRHFHSKGQKTATALREWAIKEARSNAK